MNEFLILFILKIQPSNIYEIKKFVDKNLAPFIQISAGAILPALNRLERNSAIKCEKQITQGGMRKTVYSILPDGEALFDKLLATPIISAPQLARRDIEVFCTIYGHEIFSDEQMLLLKEKIINALQDNISVLKKTIALNALNTSYLQDELEFAQKKLSKFL